MPVICFLYTDTNGLHKCSYNPSSKNLYKYARLVAFHYMIGEYNIETFKFTETLKKNIILTPKTINFDETAMKLHKITYEDAVEKGMDNKKAMMELKTDLANVDIIVSFSLTFHIKALQVECFRTAVDINFGKYINVDMASFGHMMQYPKYADMIIKYKLNKFVTQLEQYKDLFFILYKEYKKNIKTDAKQPTIKPSDDCEFVD
jgi:hypothetical protein